ncbi:MAG: ribonuclease HII [Halothiobacillus sp. 20-53-49]|nr:MAG: ribonuclease HII [Halothiobacillus sp. 20-53-49]HUN00368.1 ribonuclease HII [Halothiobacillus sp.]
MPQLPLFEMPQNPCYAGVDEAGRGPLAGSVVAAAVILDARRPIMGVNDSKKLSALARARLFDEITQKATAFAISEASVAEIDALNILQASLLAMRRAVEMLLSQGHELQRIHVDGTHCPKMDAAVWGNRECIPMIGGDGRDAAIASASILAKVTRDRQMVMLDARYPQYEFARHKGYPTARHRALLLEFGACPEHRRSFAPVRAVLT